LALRAAAQLDWVGALGRARERLAQDPTDEAGHRQLARILTWSGQRSAALRQLEACGAILAAEVGIGPSAATAELAEAIRAERLPPPPAPADGPRHRAAHGSPAEPGPATQPVADRIRVVEASAPDSAPLPAAFATSRRELPAMPPALRAAQSRLLAAILHPETEAELAEESLRALAEQPPSDLTSYRLGRVVAWSLPRYRLDRAFVSLTLLVDRGADSRERWRPAPERFGDLGELLKAVGDPAVVLLGGPGAGKSTLLRRLELDVAAGGLRGVDDRVPFLVPLNAYRAPAVPEAGPGPGPWLARRWRDRCPLLPPLDDLLADGRMLLLLDGLNEMPYADDAAQQALVAEWRSWLQDLAGRSRGNRVVFTCRDLDYSAPLSTPSLPVPQVQLEPLGDDQIREIVERAAGAAAGDVLRRLEQAPDLGSLRTPYAARLLVDQMLAGEAGPLDWVALQVSVLRRSLRRELERGNPHLTGQGGEGGGPIFTARDRRRVLQTNSWPDAYALPDDGRLFDRLSRLAWTMQVGRAGGEASQVRIRYRDAVAALDDPAAESILRAGHALGLIDDDPQRDELAFSHQLLQEHFAARRLATAADLAMLAVPWRADQVRPTLDETLAGLGRADPLPPAPGSGWEGTALQAVALTGDPDGFVAGVRAADLVLAGRCAVHLRRLRPRRSLAPELLDDLRRSLVERSRDPDADLRARIAAGLALGELGDPRLERRAGPDGECLVPPMVTIPAGAHRLGRGDGALPAEGRVHLPSFGIGVLEVTNAEWARFMAAGGYDDLRWWDTAAARDWQEGRTTADDTRAHARDATARFRADPAELERLYAGGHMASDWYAIFRERIALDGPGLEALLARTYPSGRLTAPHYWRDPAFNNPAQPVVGISWFEARAYALWLAAQTGEPFRLLGEVEWEAAAQRAIGSPDGHGQESGALGANTSEIHVWRPSPVGVFPEGDSPEGVTDLCGNIWEWTASVFGPDSDRPLYSVPRRPGTEAAAEDAAAPPDLRRVARGGAWDSPRTVAMPWVRDAILPGGRDAGYGMRLGWG
jgi:formylglycine-generating enzyme required for sulfatase activity